MPKGKTRKIKCTKCAGKGTVPLPAYLQKVLDVLPSKSVTVREIHSLLGERLTITAVHMRVKLLVGAGLLLETGSRDRARTYQHVT